VLLHIHVSIAATPASANVLSPGHLVQPSAAGPLLAWAAQHAATAAAASVAAAGADLSCCPAASPAVPEHQAPCGCCHQLIGCSWGEVGHPWLL